MEKILLAVLLAIIAGIIIAPLVIHLSAKFKASQTILHYVKEHEGKSGTPTMGGFIFIIPAALISVFFFKGDSIVACVAISVMLGYCVIGFLDDFIKIFFKRNLGLKAYQKIISQLAVAAVIAFFCFYSEHIGSEIMVPFTSKTLDLGVLYIPFIIIVFIAITNGVNLTDGLDGLSSSVSFVYFLAFAIIIYLQASNSRMPEQQDELMNLAVFSASLAGGCLAFLVFNSFKAKIFMGDTGSMALGGAVGAVAVFSGQALLIPIIGIMFMASCISVIMQVLYYKKTKKRIFLMAPLHHHFQMKGNHEAKIVTNYFIITFAAALIVLIFLIKK
jgi:phospho-N-acetylmuramoyl-pentapeptide-transferase